MRRKPNRSAIYGQAPLRITGRQAGRRQEIGKSHPGCSFSQNGQRHTDDRIQRNHTNRSQSSGKLMEVNR